MTSGTLKSSIWGVSELALLSFIYFSFAFLFLLLNFSNKTQSTSKNNTSKILEFPHDRTSNVPHELQKLIEQTLLFN